MAGIDKQTEVQLFDGVRGHDGGPVLPVRLKNADMFCFSCHRDVPCWNECCHGADITLTPYDILGLSRHFNMRPAEFLVQYTVPDIWEKADLPVAKLRMTGEDGKGPCPMLTPEGCGAYQNRPATCRYYPLGLASVKMKGDEAVDDFHFLVKESHCKGHAEDKLQSVDQYRAEQGIPDYDRVNRGWIDILMKMASWKVLGGPWGKEPSTQTKKMFFMVSTDVDAFREFVFKSKFLDTYQLDPEAIDIIKQDDEALLLLGFDWMKNVFFNEDTISMQEHVIQAAMAKARADMGAT